MLTDVELQDFEVHLKSGEVTIITAEYYEKKHGEYLFYSYGKVSTRVAAVYVDHVSG